MFKIRIETKNAAFSYDTGDCRGELTRILNEVKDKINLSNATEGVCHDINGNRVGEWKLTNR